MHLHVHHLIQHYGYGGIFVILALEMIGVPFPAETTLTLAGIWWTKGVFSLIPLVFVAALGNIAGSSIAYGIGRFLGAAVIVRFGKYFGITNERLNRARVKFEKYRATLVIFSKFIAGIRVLVPYLAGINRMSFLKFTMYNTISAFLWVTVFIVLGRYVGIAWNQYHDVLHNYLLPVIIVVIVIVGLYYGMRKRKEPKAS